MEKLEDLSQWIADYRVHRLFLVADEAAYIASNANQRIAPALKNLHVTVFSDFSANPDSFSVERGYAKLRAADADAVVVIGGGTAIDIAKLICLADAQRFESNVAQSLVLETTRRFHPRRLPFLAVPTTAGTGSEATQFAVLYLNQRKFSISHASLVPDATILDASLTHSLPTNITAATGLDAIAQSIESLWSIQSNDESMRLAEQALRIGLDHLEAAVNDPTPKDRAAMLQSANLAGKAINISRTTAAHALSYHLTIKHGIPHGKAVALFLTPCLRFNGGVNPENTHDQRGTAHVHAALSRISGAFGIPYGPAAMERTADLWQALLIRIGCETRLEGYDIFRPNDLQEIASAVNAERLANNPRMMNEQHIMEIVELIA